MLKTHKNSKADKNSRRRDEDSRSRDKCGSGSRDKCGSGPVCRVYGSGKCGRKKIWKVGR